MTRKRAYQLDGTPLTVEMNVSMKGCLYMWLCDDRAVKLKARELNVDRHIILRGPSGRMGGWTGFLQANS